jgi:hypothetical protein
MTKPATVTAASKAKQAAVERTARQERMDTREGQLAASFGFRLARKDLQDPVSAAVHEASHLMVCLSLGIGVARAIVRGDGLREHGLRGQVLYREDGRSCVFAPTRALRLAVLLGGAVGEEMTYAGVGEVGIAKDLRQAAAAARGDARELHYAVAYTRNLLGAAGRPKGIQAVAEVLDERGSLTYQQAARVAWDAGALVRFEPTFEPVVPHEDWLDLREELARIDAAWVRAA